MNVVVRSSRALRTSWLLRPTTHHAPAPAHAHSERNVVYGPSSPAPLPQEDLPTLLFNRAAKWSKLDAVECAVSGRRYNYGEIVDRSLRWVGVLSSAPSPVSNRGIRNLALYCTNSPEFPILLLGTLAAGAILTTINCSYTAEEVARQLSDSGAEAVVTDPHLEKIVTEAMTKIGKNLPVFVNGNSASGHPNLRQLLEDPARPLADPVQSTRSSTATILYSSGTTGTPKGVEMSHGAYTANLTTFTNPDNYAIQPYEDGIQEIVMGVMPNYHIYGLYLIHMLALYQGAKVISFPAFDPLNFVRVIKDYKVRVLHLVPPILNFLAKSPSVTSADLESVGVAMCAAAPIPPTTAKEFKEKAPNPVTFQEGFGMTEVLGTHMTPLNNEQLGWCGKVVPEVAAKVVDADGQALPEGQRGELCVKTHSLMTGYLNNPETTAESITADGWFHTGDVAIHQDGFFSIVDRMKDLIKVKGFQVSPSELEELLLQHPGVRNVAVVGVDDERAGELPRAYIIKADNSTMEDDLHQFLAPRVAKFKQLKGGIRFLDELPKNATGKVLKRVLKELAAEEH